MKRILVVDDDVAIARLIKINLENKGYEVVSVNSGKAALEEAKQFNPDIITLDILMPDMDGFQVMDRLKRNEETSSVPVIIISIIEGAYKKTGFRLGAADYITKPIDFERLLHSIERFTRNILKDDEKKVKILIAEDDLDTAKLIQAFVETKGFSTVIASNGLEALEKVEQDIPDLILLDLKMPKMDGFEVINRLKKDSETAKIPVIVITSYDVPGTREKCYLLGVNEFLTKPISEEKLIEEITGQLRKIEMIQEKKKVLVADDEEDISLLVKSTLESEEFIVDMVGDGKTAIQRIQENVPDLLILDVSMPKMDGYEVCRRLKKDVTLSHLPIIMLTAKGDTADKVKGMDKGVDDYITKPFDPEEMLARVRMVIKRTSRELNANPLTKLPGNVSIIREIDEHIAGEKPYAVLYIDLNKFKAFNDKYGFERGDEAIKLTARIIADVIGETSAESDFIGHIGGDDFVVIVNPEKMEQVCQKIIEEFDRNIPSLYDDEDRKRGYIISTNRQGKEEKFNLISIAIGVVTNIYREFAHSSEITTIGTEVKNYAKNFDKSYYVIDKRKM